MSQPFCTRLKIQRTTSWHAVFFAIASRIKLPACLLGKRRLEKGKKGAEFLDKLDCDNGYPVVEDRTWVSKTDALKGFLSNRMHAKLRRISSPLTPRIF